MSEEDILNEIFGTNPMWKNKYKLSWCELCDTAIISCPQCKNSSCNGGGCELCDVDFEDFHKTAKTTVYDYISDSEMKVYEKCVILKRLIRESLANGETQLDFESLHKAGKLSKYVHDMFKSDGTLISENCDKPIGINGVEFVETSESDRQDVLNYLAHSHTNKLHLLVADEFRQECNTLSETNREQLLKSGMELIKNGNMS